MIDFGALFEQLISNFWWLLPLFVLIAIFKSPWFKGVMGEFMVNMATRFFLNKNDYLLIEFQIVKPDTFPHSFNKLEQPFISLRSYDAETNTTSKIIY